MSRPSLLIDIHFVIIPVLLALSALFASIETGLFALTRTQLESMKTLRPTSYRLIRDLLRKPEEFLSTIIIANELVNIMTSTAVVAILETNFHFSTTALIIISVLVSAFFLLGFAETIPKVVAMRFAPWIAPVLAYPATLIHIVMKPFRKIFSLISRGVIRLFNINVTASTSLSEREFLTLVEAGAESGSLEKGEKELIFNVFHFGDLAVSSVMTRWTNVFTINEGTTVEHVLEKVKEKTYSRIPVFSPATKKVTGILYTKELIKLLLTPSKIKSTPLNDAIFPPYYVSSHKKVSKLFREFKAKKVHIALVVDEFGNHIGIVTLEDLLNAIFRTSSTGKEGDRA